MASSFKKFVADDTSFRRKGSDGRRIPGTKMSYQNVQLLTSTGVPSLDTFLGGGVAVGTILLVEEDLYNTYGSVLVKYFLAEGVTHSHAILLASGNVDPPKIIKEIPMAVEPKPPTFVPNDDQEDLKIAWRYTKKKSTVESAPPSIHSFDLTKTMPKEKIKKAEISTFKATCEILGRTSKSFLREPFWSLCEDMKRIIHNKHLQSTEKRCNKILRVVISSLGSPLWMSGKDSDESDLMRFLYVLKSSLRSSFATALITVPKVLSQINPRLKDKIRQISDYVIQLESFIHVSKSENPIIKDFDGLLNIVKLPVLNTFSYHVPAMDLAFKLRKKAFHVEQLHLPPDVEEPSNSDMLPCSASASSLLDF